MSNSLLESWSFILRRWKMDLNEKNNEHFVCYRIKWYSSKRKLWNLKGYYWCARRNCSKGGFKILFSFCIIYVCSKNVWILGNYLLEGLEGDFAWFSHKTRDSSFTIQFPWNHFSDFFSLLACLFASFIRSDIFFSPLDLRCTSCFDIS